MNDDRDLFFWNAFAALFFPKNGKKLGRKEVNREDYSKSVGVPPRTTREEGLQQSMIGADEQKEEEEREEGGHTVRPHSLRPSFLRPWHHHPLRQCVCIASSKPLLLFWM